MPAAAGSLEFGPFDAEDGGPLGPECEGCVGGVCGPTVLPDRVSEGGPSGAVGGVCTMKSECAECPELECVPPGWVLEESLVLGLVSVGEGESLAVGLVESESLSVGEGELLEVGDELEVVGSEEDGSFDDDVGVREDVAATAVGAYAAVTRTKPRVAVIAAQARRVGARMAMLSYEVVHGAGAGPLGAFGEGHSV